MNFIYHYNLKNFFNQDTLMDWLDIYSSETSYKKDTNNPDLLFNTLLKNQHVNFLNEYIKTISIPSYIISSFGNIRFRISKTIDAMYLKHPIIIGGVIYSDNHSYIGFPDILIHNDYFNMLYKDYKKIDGDYYVILNVWCGKIDINSELKIMNKTKRIPYMKSKNIMETICLNEMQNRNESKSFVVLKNNKIGIIDILNNEVKNYTRTLEALIWINDLRKNGLLWLDQINTLNISKKELFPNMVNKEDYPWKEVKKNIAIYIKEISLLYLCGVSNRTKALKYNVSSWDGCNIELLGIKNEYHQDIIKNMIYLNKHNLDISILPRRIKKQSNLLQLKKKKIEFFVDFETFIDFNHSEENILFMIGCLVVENERFIYKQFVCSCIEDELNIFMEWIEFMKSFTNEFYIYHWSFAEKAIFKQMIKKYSFIVQEDIIWIDLLDVFKTEPIIIKHVFHFSLKSIVRELFKLKCIETQWDDSSVMDGKNAMVQAWHIYNNTYTSDKKKNILEDIKKYNYIDCKVLQEITLFLRKKTLF